MYNNFIIKVITYSICYILLYNIYTYNNYMFYHIINDMQSYYTYNIMRLYIL